MTIEQHPVVSRDARESLQIGNDHDRKLETLRLVNRHQSHRISGLIDLSFTLATANRFKLLNVTHKVANQMRSRTFKTRGEREQSLDICESLRAVEVRRDHSQVLRFLNRETQQILNRIMMPAIDELADQLRRAIEQLVFFRH